MNIINVENITNYVQSVGTSALATQLGIGEPTLIDISKEIERLEKEQKRLAGELKRSEGMLNNERFLSKAPAEKVEEEKAKMQKYQETYDQVTARLAQLQK